MGMNTSLKKKEHKIIDVQPGSIADEIGIIAGDILLGINGESICDIIDYEALVSLGLFTLQVQDKRGKIHLFDIEMDEDETLGLVFEKGLMDQSKTCANHCIFCFIDQMPKGYRKPLYFKDDDWRLSLMMGNYITLTNISNDEFERMIFRRVSPLYISVHATDAGVRKKMMQNESAGNLISRLERLAQSKITFHCQIVVCPDINDKEVLQQTLETLFAFYPYASSVAVVPVGLTCYREGLFPLKPVDKEKACEYLVQIQRFQKKCMQKAGTAFVFAADELYVLAQKPIPAYEAYGNFPQIENGVGLFAKFEQEFIDALQDVPVKLEQRRKITVATSTSAAPFIRELIKKMPCVKDFQVQVIPVKNEFWGEHVTVAGLITGQDLKNALLGLDLGTEVLIPRCMLKEQETIFLDGYRLAQLQDEIGVPVIPVDVDGSDFAKALQGILV